MMITTTPPDKNEWTAEWMANAKEPLKQPKQVSRFWWFMLGLSIGSLVIMGYLLWLMKIG